MAPYTDIDREAARRAMQASNLDFLAAQAKLASNGYLTVVSNDDYRTAVLVRTDGQPLGFHESFGERRPTTGVQMSIYLSAYVKLSRRNRTDLRVLKDSITLVIWGDDHWGDFAQARTDIGKDAENRYEHGSR